MEKENICSHFDINIELENVEEEFLKILTQIRPTWEKKNVVYETLPKEHSKGLMNTMIKCHSTTDDKDIIMIRIHNNKMGAWLDRSREIKCIKLLQPLDCAPNILATFPTGFCYDYFHGEILNNTRLKDEPIWRLIATDFAKFHAFDLNDGSKEKTKNEQKEKMEQFLAGYPTELQNPAKNEIFKRDIPSKDELQPIIDDLMKHCEDLNSPVLLCHNDTRAENIIWNEEKQRTYFVDFELMGYGYQANELAAHFARYCGLAPPDYSLYPTEEFQMEWLRYYLEKYYEFSGQNPSDVTEKDVRKLYVQINKYYLFQLIVSGIAIPVFEAMNVIEEGKLNLLEFAVISVNEYYKEKDRIMAMTLPD